MPLSYWSMMTRVFRSRMKIIKRTLPINHILIYCSIIFALSRGFVILLNMFPQTSPLPTICFCGSFKFYNAMEKAAANLRKLGFKVIVPQPSHIRHGHKPAELKNKYDLETLTQWEGEGAFSHLENIKKSDIVYIFNKNSYLGPAVTVEIGFALALKKTILSYSEVSDITVTNFIKQVLPPNKLNAFLSSVYNG